MDPLPVVIRPTPAGPVRVPGYLQRRPFRRPGAALYRASGPAAPVVPLSPAKLKKKGRSSSTDVTTESRSPEAVTDTTQLPESVTLLEPTGKSGTESSPNKSEEATVIRSRSDENFPTDDDDGDDAKSSAVAADKVSLLSSEHFILYIIVAVFEYSMG